MPDPEPPIESPLEYAEFIAALIDRVQPAGDVEFDAAIRFARILWRGRSWEDVDLSAMPRQQRVEYKRAIARSVAEMLSLFDTLQSRHRSP